MRGGGREEPEGNDYDVSSYIERRAFELARSGAHQGYASIEMAIRLEGYLDARGELDQLTSELPVLGQRRESRFRRILARVIKPAILLAKVALADLIIHPPLSWGNVVAQCFARWFREGLRHRILCFRLCDFLQEAIYEFCEPVAVNWLRARW
jgi:hypothetical protein